MPLPRSWDEAARHPAVQSIQPPPEGSKQRWVTLAEPWVVSGWDGPCFPVYDFRDLQYMLRHATEDSANERRSFGFQ
jgi:hypothetical protein